MSPVMNISIRGLLAILALLALSACGDSNGDTFPRDTGKHPENWVLSGHKVKALNNGVDSCFECHGENGVGGISNVPCSNCHLGGPTSLHPLAWGSGPVNVTNNHGAYLVNNSIDSCASVYCHGVNLEGSSGPACVACHN